MHRPIGINQPLVFKDIRAPEARKLLGSFDKNSYVIISGNLVIVLTDNSIIYTFKLKTSIDYCRMAFQIISLEGVPEDSLIYDKSIEDFVDLRWNGIATNGDIIANIEELRGNEEFERLIEMKAAEGMHYFKMPRIDIPGRSVMIHIFSVFPKLSKPDKIGIRVIDDKSGTLLVNFHIFKKNMNREIDMYFRILDI